MIIWTRPPLSVPVLFVELFTGLLLGHAAYWLSYVPIDPMDPAPHDPPIDRTDPIRPTSPPLIL